MVNIVIPEACLNPDGDGECPCHKKPSKQERNPI